ncbi:MAG: hypothetical protein ACREGC_03450, partial [Minisyncoccia bacterium]
MKTSQTNWTDSTSRLWFGLNPSSTTGNPGAGADTRSAILSNLLAFTGGTGRFGSFTEQSAYQPSAGSVDHHCFLCVPTVNQTGTATGNQKGFYYAPIVTAVLGKLIGYENVVGDNYLNSTSGRTGVHAITTPTAFLHIGTSNGAASNAPLKFTSGTLLASTENGAMEYDGKKLYFTPLTTRSILAYTLFSQTQAITIGNTAGESSILGTGSGTTTIPADSLIVGTTIKILAYGIHSAVAVPNITINLKLNGVTIATTGAVASGNSTNNYTEIRAEFTCYTTGAGGTAWVQSAYTEA